MPTTDDGREIQYVCDICDYSGRDYDRKPTEPEGKQVRCPECGEPSLRRELV